MEIKIVTDKITADEIREMAAESYGEMIKAVADAERGIMAIGGEWHADAEALLLEQGSKQSDLWGFNIYPNRPAGQQIEFVSLINIRPRQNNKNMEIEDPEIRKKIFQIFNKLVIY